MAQQNYIARRSQFKAQSSRRLPAQGCIKLLDFSLSFIGWRRGQGRGGAFLLAAPLLGPLPAPSSRGEDGELDAGPPPAPARLHQAPPFLPLPRMEERAGEGRGGFIGWPSPRS